MSLPFSSTSGSGAAEREPSFLRPYSFGDVVSLEEDQQSSAPFFYSSQLNANPTASHPSAVDVTPYPKPCASLIPTSGLGRTRPLLGADPSFVRPRRASLDARLPSLGTTALSKPLRTPQRNATKRHLHRRSLPRHQCPLPRTELHLLPVKNTPRQASQ